LRILIFTGKPIFGIEQHGGATHLTEVARGLCTLGHKVIIGSMNYKLKKSVSVTKENHITNISIKPNTHLFSALVSLGVVFKFIKNIKRCDLVYIRASPDDFIGTLIGILWNVPIILEANDPTWTWPTLKWADRIITPHKSLLTLNIEGKKIEGHWLAKIEKRSTIMFPGVNVEVFNPKVDGNPIRKRYNIPLDNFVIIYSGGFYAWHGIEDLIEASSEVVERCPKAYFMLVGHGPLYRKAINMVSRKGLKDHFIFTGKVPHTLMPSFIAAADIAVAPYCPQRDIVMKKLGFYGAPGIKTLEYMAAGKPIIATNVGDMSKIIQNGFNGILIEPCNPEALAKAILYLIKNREISKRLSINARKVSELLSWNQHIEKLLFIFRGVYRNRRSIFSFLIAVYDLLIYCLHISVRRVLTRLHLGSNVPRLRRTLG